MPGVKNATKRTMRIAKQLVLEKFNGKEILTMA